MLLKLFEVMPGLIENRNVFYKHEVRMRLAEAKRDSEEVFGIHGSDSAYEAQHMLRTIYAEDAPEVN